MDRKIRKYYIMVNLVSKIIFKISYSLVLNDFDRFQRSRGETCSASNYLGQIKIFKIIKLMKMDVNVVKARSMELS